MSPVFFLVQLSIYILENVLFDHLVLSRSYDRMNYLEGFFGMVDVGWFDILVSLFI